MTPRCRNPMVECPISGQPEWKGYCSFCGCAGVPELVEALRPFHDWWTGNMDGTALPVAHIAFAAAIVTRSDGKGGAG